jgi:hypothetical protein
MKYTINKAEADAIPVFERFLRAKIFVKSRCLGEFSYIFVINPIEFNGVKIERIEFKHTLIDDILNGATEEQLKDQLEVCCKTSAD